MDYDVSTQRISTGINRLDAMLGGKGVFCGSSILVSGTAGTGKSSIAASFADAVCRRGERCIYFSFEESPNQIIRNMHSIGIDLDRWVKNDLLRFHAVRATFYALEMHLLKMDQLIDAFKPQAVVVDPISNLCSIATQGETKSMLARIIDFLKRNQITAMFTDLTHVPTGLETSETEISSLMDTWFLIRDIESNGERNRGLYVLKSRGMAHSNQIREFLLTDKGVDLIDVYSGPAGVLTGSARSSQEAKEKSEKRVCEQEIEVMQRKLERKRKVMDTRIAAIQAEFQAEEEGLKKLIKQEKEREQLHVQDREKIGLMRGKDKD